MLDFNFDPKQTSVGIGAVLSHSLNSAASFYPLSSLTWILVKQLPELIQDLLLLLLLLRPPLRPSPSSTEQQPFKQKSFICSLSLGWKTFSNDNSKHKITMNSPTITSNWRIPKPALGCLILSIKMLFGKFVRVYKRVFIKETTHSSDIWISD